MMLKFQQCQKLRMVCLGFQVSSWCVVTQLQLFYDITMYGCMSKALEGLWAVKGLGLERQKRCCCIIFAPLRYLFQHQTFLKAQGIGFGCSTHLHITEDQNEWPSGSTWIQGSSAKFKYFVRSVTRVPIFSIQQLHWQGLYSGYTGVSDSPSKTPALFF